MARVTVEDCLKQVKNRFVLVLIATYRARMLAQGHRLPLMLRHIQGLFTGLPNARAWRRYLTEHAIRPGAGREVLRDSLRMFRAAA